MKISALIQYVVLDDPPLLVIDEDSDAVKTKMYINFSCTEALFGSEVKLILLHCNCT